MSTPTECGVAPADISDADTDEDANDDDDADDDDDDGEEEDDDDGDAAIKRLLMEIVVFDTGPNTPGTSDASSNSSCGSRESRRHGEGLAGLFSQIKKNTSNRWLQSVCKDPRPQSWTFEMQVTQDSALTVQYLEVHG
ncbi:hypothetical protein AK812_SmicGene3659 [Symbiodinium microadriaticum]|uniref:Uncharacterized protein n=1 Tax=Symbiodinium microadriaticum TaxID=2951 RepID=A0A1Q9EYH8_SYMMI|nr:hypothetical protein AK812_SmicGene3659 [Symbiodinium microadriaticum]